MEIIVDEDTQFNLVAMDKMLAAELNHQIEVARRFPRSVSRASQRINSLVTVSKDSAESCYYTLPRSGKPIMGPSIRLAEMVQTQWGNNVCGARGVETNLDEGWVEAEGVFHDLETNTKVVKRVRKRIIDKNGNLFNSDMINVTMMAAAATAQRNAILAGVPKFVWEGAYSSAMKMVRGETKTLGERRDAAIASMAGFGLSDTDVLAILELESLKDIRLDHLVILGGILQSLKDEHTTAEDLRENAGLERSGLAKHRGHKEPPKQGVSAATSKKKTGTKETGEKAKPLTDDDPQNDLLSGVDQKASRALVDRIKNEICDAADPDEVIKVWDEQIAELAAEYQTEIAEEYEAYKEAARENGEAE